MTFMGRFHKNVVVKKALSLWPRTFTSAPPQVWILVEYSIQVSHSHNLIASINVHQG